MLAKEDEEVEVMSPWSNLPDLVVNVKIQARKNGAVKKGTGGHLLIPNLEKSTSNPLSATKI